MVIFVDGYVFLVGQELFCLFPILSIFLEHLSNLLGFSDGFLPCGNLSHFALVNQLLSDTG